MSKEIAANVRTLADAIKPTISYSADTGIGEAAGLEDVFAKHLPESINIETVKLVQESLLDLAAAQTLACAELSQGIVTKDQPNTSLKTKVGYSQLETSYIREKSGVAMGKPWQKFGVVDTDLTLGVGRKNGNYKAVVAYAGEEATKAFSN